MRSLNAASGIVLLLFVLACGGGAPTLTINVTVERDETSETYPKENSAAYADGTCVGSFCYADGQIGSESFSSTQYRIGQFTFTDGNVGLKPVSTTSYPIGQFRTESTG